MDEFIKLNDIILTDKLNTDKIFYRDACRAVIIENDKLLLLKSKKYGEYIVPGGGVNKDETLIEGLKREVLEEAGIKIKNIKPFVTITEYRKPLEKDLELTIMKSYIFICEIDSENNPTNMEDYEKEYGYENYKVTVEEAIENNNKLIRLNKPIWIHRETAILEAVKNHMNKK